MLAAADHRLQLAADLLPRCTCVSDGSYGLYFIADHRVEMCYSSLVLAGLLSRITSAHKPFVTHKKLCE